jgi:glutamyl-tRNA synthetase
LIGEEWKKAGIQPATHDRQWLLSTIELLKPRARNLKDFANAFRGYFTDDFSHDPAAVEKFLSDGSTRQMLSELAERYSGLQDFSEQNAEQTLRDFAAEKGMKAGALINGSRVALTGQAVAPSLFAVMQALGKQKTVDRLRAAKDISIAV